MTSPVSSRTRQHVFAAFDKWKSSGDLLALGEFDRTLVLAWSLKGMIDNGGLVGFFDTSTAQYCDENVAAMNRIGAAQVARIVQAANSIVAQYDRNRLAKPLLAASRPLLVDDTQLAALEREFFERSTHVWQLLDEYVTKNTDGPDPATGGDEA